MNLGFAKVLDRVAGSLLGHAIATGDAIVETIRAPTPVEHVRRLLVIKFWGLGNWALLRPVVRDLRARYPGARLTIATLDTNRRLVQDLADDLLLVRADSGITIARDLGRAVLWLRRRRHDLALDFEQFSRTGALLARCGGVAQRMGFRSGSAGRDRLYTVTVPFRRDDHVTRSFRDLAEAGGLAKGAYVPGGLRVDDEARASAARWTTGRPFVVLHPGSGDNFPGRRWSESGFVAVGRTAAAHGHRVFVTGGRQETELAQRVADAIGDFAASLAGRLGIDQLVALLDDATALVSNDTGPVHIASQLGTPVLAFFGPNTPVLYGPLSEGSQSFFRDLPCSPCLRNSNYRSSRCRIFTCMASIPTGEVAAALVRLMDRARSVVR